MSTDEDRQATERALVSVRKSARRERQRLEIVTLLLGGDLGRARGLAAEHLAEFPHDPLIRHLLDVHRDPTSTETGGAE